MKTVIEKRMMNFQTDSFGIVHHARYLEMMEEARWQYCHENHLMEAFHQKGIFHVVVNINIDYKGSARFGDLITIETEVFHTSEKSVVFRQIVLRDGHQLARADITNVFMKNEDRRVVTVSELGEFWDDVNKEPE